MKPITPADLPALRRTLTVDRPLHWEAARALLLALERAWAELAALDRRASAGASGREREAREEGAVRPEQVADEGLAAGAHAPRERAAGRLEGEGEAGVVARDPG